MKRNLLVAAPLTREWWDELPVSDKKSLWGALPEWKWDLYGHAVQQKNDGVASNLVEWMQLEEDPYWHVVCSMYGHDMAVNIRAFLQTRERCSEPEVYALPL